MTYETMEIINRLKNEYDELQNKFLKLSVFLERPNLRGTMDYMQLEYMKEQKHIMLQYLAVLKARIELLEDEVIIYKKG